MIDPVSFALAAFALLAAPGPTNTLLAVAGATNGFAPSVRLIGASIFGFLVTTLALAFVLGPVVARSPWLAAALKISCALYLLYAAAKLWRQARTVSAAAESVPFLRVFTATALNPKALVLAFVIIPFSRPDWGAYVLGLVAIIVLSGSVWIALGALLKRRARGALGAGAVQRGGALTLGAFSVLVAVSALGG